WGVGGVVEGSAQGFSCAMMALFVRLLWLLSWGILPVAFLPAASNPFGPVKRDVFALLAVAQAVSLALHHAGRLFRAAQRLTRMPVAWGVCAWALWGGLVLVREGDPRQGYYGIVESLLGAGTALGLMLETRGAIRVKSLWCLVAGVSLAW